MGAKQSNIKEDHTKFPFWCGYLPDAALELLKNKNEFTLRCLKNDSLSLTLYGGPEKLTVQITINENIDLVKLLDKQVETSQVSCSNCPTVDYLLKICQMCLS
uniref:Uncharacterized protein n=1 Tax=Meloidogyne javanica TaxID=6303 RepID=A0A915LQC1_MELJA